MNLHEHSEMCDCEVIHSDVVNRARELMEDTEILYAVSDFFKVMCDSTRMRIMAALDNGEMCVCDLSALLNMTKSAVSHQLKILRISKLIRSEKKGKNVYYALNDDHVQVIFAKALEHICE